MFKSNKTLGIVFFVLLIIVALMIFSDRGGEERTFRKNLVLIDTSAVTDIYLYPKSAMRKEVRLFKNGSGWKVELENGKTADVPKSKITNMMAQLLSIKPKRLAARNISKWREFEVDSLGTRVRVLEDGDETLNIIIGKFSFQQPRQMSTYVRLANDTDVYEVDGFLDMTFNQKANSFRNSNLFSGENDSWRSLSFNYPADSSFVLTKTDGIWELNGLQTDSAETDKYLNSLSRVNSTNFVDEFDSKILDNETYRLTIVKEDGSSNVVSGFLSDSLFIIHSDFNPLSYFDGNSNKLGGKIFVGKNKFFK